MVKGPEATIEAAIEWWCRSQRILCIKLADLGRRGFPDRTLILPGGQIVFVEIKAPGGTLSYHQIAYHERLTARGQTVLIVHSLDELVGRLELSI